VAVKVCGYSTATNAALTDDVAWNASLRDFADKHDVPCYNYLKTLGIALLSRSDVKVENEPSKA
jgi:hypothetical protein